ncbi:DNA recombination protein RmuC [Montanilutibacter psychrotolerans]|uniref:DNA recombination protein RmuC n=1 Tax=Montanilutibacter psychrotolerans TaxID=1327343 RepID=A0A3M8SVZ8_9GAMM|nr:DNA recombination protein RmuC [Lysobacter psychrotolerans]RNF83636.1 DNA recombination protein RmuC [Lysobacter psychrotolerans]
MPETSLLLVVLLIAVLVAIVLLVILLLRRPDALLDAHNARLEQALRAEQRDGRGELRAQLDSLSAQQEQRIEGFSTRLNEVAARTDQHLRGLSERTDARLDLLRDALGEDARKSRTEAAELQQRFADVLGQRLAELTQRNELRIGDMRATLEQKLGELQDSNTAKLEQMRATVDEKLQTTLEARLGESFRLVSERLEQVQRGLGEMQQLAVGVGDLKRVLTNVKTRGTFGEVQLGALLEQVLTIEQYDCNVITVPGSNQRVEFAVRLPGAHADQPVRLPIDAKFPREDYERLLDAQDRADVDAIALSSLALERRIKEEARKIQQGYVAPPHTTDFALMFLPTEGLYAEVLRRPGLFDVLQREFRVTVVGPTTLLALLNSLQMGFRTLAIEQRSSEVWQLLGAVKSEFGKFATVLEKTHSQLDTVRNSIKAAGVRTRAIERQLKGVESLPVEESRRLLGDFVEEDE